MNALTPFTTPAAHVILPGGGADQPLTMSSREIAKLLGNRHDNVKRTVERLVDQGVIGRPPLEDDLTIDAQGKERLSKVYLLDKRSSLIVVAQLSPEFTARVVDRWQELEAQASKPAFALPQSLPEALRFAAEQAERAITAEDKLAIAGPKADILDVLVHKEDTHSLTQAAKHFDVAPRAQFIKTLRDHKVLYPVKGGVLVPAEQYRKAGYFVVRYAIGAEGLPQQTRVTHKGMSWLATKLDRFFREAA